MSDEDAPDVDYEGEEEDEEQVIPGPAVADGGELLAAVKPGAGDSETDDGSGDDDDDDEAGGGPRPPPPSSGDTKGGVEDGEINGGKEGNTDNKKDTATTTSGSDGLFRPHAPSSIMDRALSAPRETPGKQHPRDGGTGNNHRDTTNQNGGGGGGRASRWGARPNNGSEQRTMMKQPPEEKVSVYIPPAKRRLLEEQRKAAELTAKESIDSSGDGVEGGDNKSTSKENTSPTKISKAVTPIHIQRQTWESLQRSINGTINRLSPSTIKPLIHSLFSDANLLRGRGVLTRSILHAAQASPQYAPTYTALMAVVNTKLPECGELLLTRAILAFRKGYKRRDRNTVSSTLALLGHLFNQGMAHELLSLQILTVLLDGDPTEDSVDVAVGYMCVVGKQLTEVSPAGVHAVMERFRGLLHEGSIGRRAQYRIETLLKIKRGGFRDYPTIPDEDDLDLVEREDQITFELGLDDEGLRNEEGLDVFRFDEEYDEKEEEWKNVRAEILGEDSDDDDDESGSESGSSGSESESEDEKDEVQDQAMAGTGDKKTVVIEDLTETDLVHLRRTIYLTIMSSATFEECTHKLAKMDIPDGRECELINMIIECCSQERTFLRYYGLISGRFCLLHERWQDAFEEGFATQYNTIHRLETNKLRNVAKLFGHLLHTDSISWSVLSCIHLNEDETTSSSRIFIKILVQEMAEAMGMVTLKQRFDTDNPAPDGPVGEDAIVVAAPNGNQESSTREWFKGMFPKDNARSTRYAINFFTSIGLGPLTDGMREFLKNAPKLILAQAQAQAAREAAQREKDDDESSVVSSSSSDTSSFDSSSSSSSGSSMSSSSYSSSSYSSQSSDSRYRRKKSGGRGGRDSKRSSRRRSRSYSSSSSSGSDSSPDSRRRRKMPSSKDKRRGDGAPSDGSRGNRERNDDDSRNDGASAKANTPDSRGSKRRSVSESPRRKEGHRRRRSYSSSRSRSPDGGKGRSNKSPSDKQNGDDQKLERRGQKKRGRSSSYSSASRSRSPPPRKESSSRSKKGGSDDRKRSRRMRSNSRDVSAGRS